MRRIAPLKHAEERLTMNEKSSEEIRVTYSVISDIVDEDGGYVENL